MDEMENQNRPLSSARSVQNYIFAAILLILFLIVLRLFTPFFTVILWSVLLYIIVTPLHSRVIRGMKFKTRRDMILKNVWAAVFALLTMVVILLPLSFVAFLFFRQIMELMRMARDYLYDHPETIHEYLERLSGFLYDLSSGQIDLSAVEIQRQIVVRLTAGLQNIVSFSRALAVNVGSFVLGIALMLFCLFFFFADGPYLANLVMRSIPIRKDYLGALKRKFTDITRNLLLGYIMVAMMQAVLAYIIFTIFNVQGALVFGVLTFICVFIPMFGGGLVWIPLGLMRVMTHGLVSGIVFMIVAGGFISLSDNFIRPMFLQNRIQLHPLIIFFAIFGGVRVFGFNGLILGPMAVILFLTVLDLFLTEHRINE